VEFVCVESMGEKVFVKREADCGLRIAESGFRIWKLEFGIWNNLEFGI
jgi:hypothetical protein